MRLADHVATETMLRRECFIIWRCQPLARLLCLRALTLVAYWIFSSADALSKSLWTLAAVPLFLILCEGLFYLAKYCTEDWSKASQNAEIMSDCISHKTKTIHWIVEYRQLMKLREIPGAFLLYFDLNSYHLIPKRGSW